jgi:hypothetical protein
LALAQHYGLATRLLDWTANPLVALFFPSVAGGGDGWYGGAYALLQPQKVTEDVAFAECGRAHFPNQKIGDRPSYENPFNFEKVLTFVPRPFDPRMLPQAAVFTYHVQPATPLEPIRVGQPSVPTQAWKLSADPTATLVGADLIEFIVAPEYKDTIRRGLASLGIRDDTLFPDLDGLSRQFNFNFQSRIQIRTRGIPPEELPPPSDASGNGGKLRLFAKTFRRLPLSSFRASLESQHARGEEWASC